MLEFFKRFSKKAVTGGGTVDYDNLFKLIHGNLENQTYSAQELLKLNNGWVYACNNKNAMTVATIPLHLYYNNKSQKNIKWTKHHKLAKKELSNLRYSINDITIKQSEEIVEIEQHPFLDLLKNINSDQNYCDFTYLIESYLGLIGNSYILVVQEKGTTPNELKLLQSENVAIMVDETGKITGYKETRRINGVEKALTYKPEEIIHVKNAVPGSPYYGKGELESCLMPVQRYNYYDLAEAYTNKNYSRPDFIVSYKGRYTEKELKDAQKQWYKQFGNPKNSGKPLITSELDVHDIGFSPREMMFKDGREWCKKEIAAVFGVPEPLLTAQETNYAASKSSINHYMSFTIVPKVRLLCEKYNEQLLPKYDSGLFVWYSDSDFMQPNEMTYPDVLAAQTQGILTINEARDAMGFEPSDEEKEVTA